jgi:hypothetical protein
MTTDRSTLLGASRPPTLTLLQALKEIGWLPALYASIVGGPSLLSILQTVSQILHRDFRLSGALQWIVDGYNELTAYLSALVEPFATPAINWLNEVFNWHLTLYPHWRPLFLLVSIFAITRFREEWRFAWGFADLPNIIFSRTMLRSAALFRCALYVAWILVGALIAGVLPPQPTWWLQGTLAALPMSFFAAATRVYSLTMLMVVPQQQKRDIRRLFLVRGKPVHVPLRTRLAQVTRQSPTILLFATVCWVAVFTLAATFSFVDAIGPAAGIVTIVGMIVAYALWLLSGAHAGDVRSGLSMLSGFITAGMVVAADALVKWLG